jgi:decaprenyl-phosphate phosphoribosyltransferase
MWTTCGVGLYSGPSESRSMNPYVKMARPDHWVKNLFVLPGTMAAVVMLKVPALPLIRPLLLGLASVCLISSAGYVINEWLDARFDRFHPVKRLRPSVAGSVRRGYVYLSYILLALAGLLLGLAVSLPFLWTALCLLVMGLLYNVQPFRTKDRAYLDVLSESINNPIRLLMGWFVVTNHFLPPSTLVLGYWMAGAFLMAVKRYSEFRVFPDRETAGRYRRSFARYSEESLLLSSVFYAIIASLLIGVFMIKYRVELVLTFPLLAILFVWYLHVGLKPDSAAQHPEWLYREKGLFFFVLLLAALIVVLLLVDIPWLHILLSNALLTF